MSHEKSINNNNSQKKPKTGASPLCSTFSLHLISNGDALKSAFHVLTLCVVVSQMMQPGYF